MSAQDTFSYLSSDRVTTINLFLRALTARCLFQLFISLPISDIGQKSHRGTSEEDIMVEQRKNQTVTKLHEILRPFLLRRVKADVLKEMPPKKEVVVYSGMSKLQLGYADLIEKGVLREELLRQGIMDGKNLSQTNKMMNQRKNVNHPFLFGEPLDPSTGQHIGTSYPQLLVRASGKFALLDRMLDRLHKGACGN